MNEQTAPPAAADFIDGGTLELSSTFAAVTTALAKAQADFPAIEKNCTAYVKSDKGDFSFDYADLAAVLGAVTPALSKVGIALLQPVTNAGGEVRVQTWLIHGESGQWIRSKPLALPIQQKTAKELGIAITYLRRYQVGALLGIAPEQDVDEGLETERRDTRRAPPPPARALEQTPGGAPPADPVSECRAAIAEKSWNKAAACMALVRNTATREQLQKELQAARQAEKKNGATTTSKETTTP